MARRRATRRPTRGPARKRAQARTPALPKLPVLEQHHLDLIGLGLVAFATFLGFVLYIGSAGGRVGEATEDALRFLLGGAAFLVPPALCATGAILVLRPLLPSVRPFRTGAICLILGVTLGLAAGSLGLGPGRAAHEPLLDPGYVSDRGGALGELLFASSSALFSVLGAHILFLFLMTGGVLLVTGRLDRGGGQGGRRAREHHHAAGAHRRRSDHRCARTRHGGRPLGPTGAARCRAGGARDPRGGARA